MHFLLSFLIQLLDLTPPKFPLFQGQYLRGQHYQCHECALKVSSVYSPTQDASHKWRLRLGFPILKNDVILVVTVTGWGENWCLFWKLKGIYTPFLNWLVVEPSIWKVVEFRSFPQTGMKINEDFKPPPMVMNISTFRIQQIFPMENQKTFPGKSMDISVWKRSRKLDSTHQTDYIFPRNVKGPVIKYQAFVGGSFSFSNTTSAGKTTI